MFWWRCPLFHNKLSVVSLLDKCFSCFALRIFFFSISYFKMWTYYHILAFRSNTFLCTSIIYHFTGQHCLVWTCEVIWSREIPQMLCSYCSEETVMFLSGSKLQIGWKLWTDTAVSSFLLLFLIDSSSTLTVCFSATKVKNAMPFWIMRNK